MEYKIVNDNDDNMRPDFIIETLRESLFAPQVACDWEFVSGMQCVLHNAIPSLVTDTPQFIDNVLFTPGEWVLNSQDDKVSVIFKAQKIDCVVNLKGGKVRYTEDELGERIRLCSDVLKRVVELKDLKANRMAISPTFKYYGDESEIKGFVQEIFSKNDFRDSYVENCDFSQVFRIEETISGEPIKINYLSKFFSSPALIVENGTNTLQDNMFLNLDINTSVNPKYRFEIGHITDFFNKANGFCSEFMKWYFKD